MYVAFRPLKGLRKDLHKMNEKVSNHSEVWLTASLLPGVNQCVVDQTTSYGGSLKITSEEDFRSLPNFTFHHIVIESSE